MTAGSSAFEQFMVQALHNYVRLRGGVADDVRHAAQHLHHHGSKVDAGHIKPAEPQESPAMSLANIVAEIKTAAEEGEARFKTILEEHLPQAATLAMLIETNPIFASVEGALHVPPDLLAGVAKTLDAMAAAFPKPAPAQALAEAPAEPEGDHPEQSAA